MKKILSILLCVCCLTATVGLVGCGNKEEKDSTPKSSANGDWSPFY